MKIEDSTCCHVHYFRMQFDSLHRETFDKKSNGVFKKRTMLQMVRKDAIAKKSWKHTPNGDRWPIREPKRQPLASASRRVSEYSYF